MSMKELSEQGKSLVKMYEEIADIGYDRVFGDRVSKAYNDFELSKFRDLVRPHFLNHSIGSVLDYGCGGSDWTAAGFDPMTGASAQEFFEVKQVRQFEPARKLLQKKKSDCVVCFDVLEHIFLADIKTVVRDLFSLSKKLLVVNVACYSANALLPNGENAHVTIREPGWWKGMIDSVAADFPSVNVILICSKSYVSGVFYGVYNANQWIQSDSFSIEQTELKFGEDVSVAKPITLTADQIFEAVDLLTTSEPETIPRIASLMANNIQSIASPQTA